MSDFTSKKKSIPLSSEILLNGTLTSVSVMIADDFAQNFFPDELPSEPIHSAVEAVSRSAIPPSLDEIPPAISDWESETVAVQ